MIFADDALARLKVACLASLQEHGNKDAKDILSLIGRLEAAEAFIAAAWLGKPHESLDDAYKLWCKAAGR